FQGLPKADTASINQLIEASKTVGDRDTDSSLHLLQQTLRLSKQSGYKRGQLIGYLGIGIRLVVKQDFVKARHYLDSALYYANLYGIQDTALSKMKVLVLNAFAMYHVNQGGNAQAINYYYRSLAA